MTNGTDHPESTKGLRLKRFSLALVGLAALMGWGASFVGLHAYGQEQMAGFNYWTAWLIPATFDGAAFGATLITYRASIYGRPALRGRLLMWAFTAISAWINWIHQLTPEARLVACGLPVAAVAVFDVVLNEMRADYEETHGKRRFRLRPGLLALRWLVDKPGTAAAFREQITGISVAEIAGLGDVAADREPATNGTAVVPETVPVAWSILPQAPAPTTKPTQLDSDRMPERHAGDQQVAATAARPAGGVPVVPERKPAGESVSARVPEESAESTNELPVIADGEPGAMDDRAAARQLVRQNPDGWTGKAIAEKFGYGERWGRNQIAAARAELAASRPPLAAVCD